MIGTVQDLRTHLEIAIQVELSTIPPYLYAMYSIEDQTSDAALLIRSVVVEEMLHAALAANLMVAVGGNPDFRSSAYMPSFPELLPHHSPPLMMELERATPEVVRNRFMVIEQPEVRGAPAEEDNFHSLGQFYQAVEISIEHLNAEVNLFENPRVETQMSDPSWYGAVEFDAEDSGGLVAVTDMTSAIEAIEIIVHQGEGLTDERWADPSHQELTHYHKFLQIAEGVVPLGEVRPAAKSPKRDDMAPELRPVVDLFNAAYRLVFLAMAAVFEDRPDKHASIGSLYSIMAGIMPPVARYLMSQPIDNEQVAGPTFEVYEFTSDSPVAEVAELAVDVAATHAELANVADGLNQLSPNSIESAKTRP